MDNMAEPKNPKMRLQWQDGVGNMLVLEEEENQDKKTVRYVNREGFKKKRERSSITSARLGGGAS